MKGKETMQYLNRCNLYVQEIPCHQSAVRYYHPDTGRLEASSLLGLQYPNTPLQDLLSKDNYWIDVIAPTVTEMKTFSKVRCTEEHKDICSRMKTGGWF